MLVRGSSLVEGSNVVGNHVKFNIGKVNSYIKEFYSLSSGINSYMAYVTTSNLLLRTTLYNSSIQVG